MTRTGPAIPSATGGELTARSLALPHLEPAQVDRQFVDKDERRLAAEQLLDGGGAGRTALLITAAYPLVALPAARA